MKINNVVWVPNANKQQILAFNRKLKEEEKQDYSKTINDTLDYLGIVNRALIIHGPSFPSDETKNIDQKIGSPYNSEKFIQFAKLHGFNSIQLGPTGKLNKTDNSPYVSSVFAKNPLFIDFELLTTPNYASILSLDDDVYSQTYPTRGNAFGYDKVDYTIANEIVDNLIEKAYENFKKRLLNNDSMAEKLNSEFLKFQENNASWLEYYSVLDVIANKYKTDDYSKWEDNDRTLIYDVKNKKDEALKRYNEIIENNLKEIEKYKFAQFIIDKQSNEDEKSHKDFVFISDLLVGASYFDELLYMDAFDKEYKIGAKWGGKFGSPQLWNISLLNPNKLFNEDGSLGPAGEFLKIKIQKALSNASNIRIDHAMGLIDPFVYKPESIVYEEQEDENGEIVKYPIREKLESGYLSQMGIDKNKNYQKIISKIVLPVMREMGVNPKDAVWEDLGADETGVFNEVFKSQEDLPGINVLAWQRGENSNQENWAYIGGHDNLPLSIQIENNNLLEQDAFNPDYLAGYLNPSPKRVEERNLFRQKITESPKELLKAKMADLMRSTKNTQMTFMDFFGIKKYYNIPGTVSEDNWSLRLSSNYEDIYYKALSDNGYAINMPEILSIALQAKADMDVVREEKTQQQSDEEVIPLMEKLEHYKRILKEEE